MADAENEDQRFHDQERLDPRGRPHHARDVSASGEIAGGIPLSLRLFQDADQDSGRGGVPSLGGGRLPACKEELKRRLAGATGSVSVILPLKTGAWHAGTIDSALVAEAAGLGSAGIRVENSDFIG